MNGLSVLLLGFLYRNGSGLTGYDISKSLESRFIYMWNASHQQVYRELNRMAEDELVNCVLHPQDGKPDRKIYHISPAGVDALRETVHTFEIAKIKDLKSDFERDLISAYIYIAESLGMIEDIHRIIDTTVSTLTRLLASISKLEDEVIKEPVEALCAAKKRREIILSLEWLEEIKEAL